MMPSPASASEAVPLTASNQDQDPGFPVSAWMEVLFWLIRDTFRHAVVSGLFWLMLGFSAVGILFCASVGVSEATPTVPGNESDDFLPREVGASRQLDGAQAPGELTLAFGAFRVGLGRDVSEAVRFLHLLLGGAIADTVGVLLALVWTAGFLPAFLHPQVASVMLTKPVSRWFLFLGKCLAVLVYVAFHAILFVGGTWLALAVRTNVWETTYLLTIPLLLVHFAVFFSLSALLAVWTRSTVVAVVGSVLFWMLCWGMNFGRHAVVGMPIFEGLSGSFSWLVESGYWLLPKPADLGIILFDALGAGSAFSKPPRIEAMQTSGAFHPILSMVTSLVFAVGVLAVAGYELAMTDY